MSKSVRSSSPLIHRFLQGRLADCASNCGIPHMSGRTANLHFSSCGMWGCPTFFPPFFSLSSTFYGKLLLFRHILDALHSSCGFFVCPPPTPAPTRPLRHTHRLTGLLIQTVSRLAHTHENTLDWTPPPPPGPCTPLAGQTAVLLLVDGLSCPSSLQWVRLE